MARLLEGCSLRQGTKELLPNPLTISSEHSTSPDLGRSILPPVPSRSSDSNWLPTQDYLSPSSSSERLVPWYDGYADDTLAETLEAMATFRSDERLCSRHLDNTAPPSKNADFPPSGGLNFSEKESIPLHHNILASTQYLSFHDYSSPPSIINIHSFPTLSSSKRLPSCNEGTPLIPSRKKYLPRNNEDILASVYTSTSTLKNKEHRRSFKTDSTSCSTETNVLPSSSCSGMVSSPHGSDSAFSIRGKLSCHNEDSFPPTNASVASTSYFGLSDGMSLFYQGRHLLPPQPYLKRSIPLHYPYSSNTSIRSTSTRHYQSYQGETSTANLPNITHSDRQHVIYPLTAYTVSLPGGQHGHLRSPSLFSPISSNTGYGTSVAQCLAGSVKILDEYASVSQESTQLLANCCNGSLPADQRGPPPLIYHGPNMSTSTDIDSRLNSRKGTRQPLDCRHGDGSPVPFSSGCRNHKDAINRNHTDPGGSIQPPHLSRPVSTSRNRERSFVDERCLTADSGSSVEGIWPNLIKKDRKIKPSCLVCHKVFASTHNVKVHMRIHNNQKPHKCQICGKAFTQFGNLKIHTRTHTGEKPYGCKYCDKRFSQSSASKNHEQIHERKQGSEVLVNVVD